MRGGTVSKQVGCKRELLLVFCQCVMHKSSVIVFVECRRMVGGGCVGDKKW